uniref:protein-serine/threonine phosphatase n=1 Tax=Anser cygnoides TaxID=8845 RepID=A0A8B9DTA7_ANSCY
MVKGAALLLPAEEPLVAEPPPAAPPGRQEQHLQLMMQLLRPQDAIRLAVRLESVRPQRVRYLLVVRPEEAGAEGQTVLLGVDFPHEGSTHCTLGMVLPLWSDTQVFLDGDGGFSVMSGGQTRIFKPISVQTMWAVLQELHRACEQADRGGHIPGGPALLWARDYAAALSSEQSCLNEWLAMADLESVRPGSPQPPGLAQHKDFIDNEMLLVLAQMDRPSCVFPHLYLGSEWNAANLEELQQNRITHILNVAREIDNFFPALFTYMNVRVYDEEAAELLPHWNDTFLFLSDVKARGGRALVHCRMGLSRSAATVLAYAMKEFGWPLERALRHVRRCRPGVLPNPGFMRQLDFYQGILSARWAGREEWAGLSRPRPVGGACCDHAPSSRWGWGQRRPRPSGLWEPRPHRQGTGPGQRVTAGAPVAAGTASSGSPGRQSARPSLSRRRLHQGTRLPGPSPEPRPLSLPRRRAGTRRGRGCRGHPSAPASPSVPSCGASA